MINQSNLFSFAFVDPTMFLSTLTLKYAKHFERSQPPFQDCEYILLRAGDVDLPLMNEWPTARQLVSTIGSTIRADINLAAENLQIGRVYVESLYSGGVIHWHADGSSYAKEHHRFRLLISPCSGGQWFSGGEMLVPGVGNLTYFNNCVLHSAINLGPVRQISLVVDVRRPVLQ
jgi:hypothetical protein